MTVLSPFLALIGGHFHGEGRSVLEVLGHSFMDILPMIPILLALYFVLEYFWHHKGLDLLGAIRMSGSLGPLYGTALGLLPQCGMSVFMTSLYLTRKITLGTLVATYLATSDEALPVFIAHGDQWGTIAQVLIAKAAIAIPAGYLIDVFVKQRHYSGVFKAEASTKLIEVKTEMETAPWKEVLWHSAKRTLRIFAWVYGIVAALGVAMYYFDPAEVLHALPLGGPSEVAIATLFGSIPNCAASLALAEAYLHMGVSFGAAMAGLSAGAGFGPIVLFKDGDPKRAALIMGLTIGIAFAFGITLNWIMGT